MYEDRFLLSENEAHVLKTYCRTSLATVLLYKQHVYAQCMLSWWNVYKVVFQCYIEWPQKTFCSLCLLRLCLLFFFLCNRKLNCPFRTDMAIGFKIMQIIIKKNCQVDPHNSNRGLVVFNLISEPYLFHQRLEEHRQIYVKQL